MERADYRLIYLRRANPLKAVLSWINGRRLADKTQQWNRASAGRESSRWIRWPSISTIFRKGLRHRQVIESLHKWYLRHVSGAETGRFLPESMLERSSLHPSWRG